MMKGEEFDRITRAFLKRQPFQPFVIECDSGRRFIVHEPAELHSFAGAATYWHADGELDLIDPEDVTRVVEVPMPAAS
jgi:hypothetical protein